MDDGNVSGVHCLDVRQGRPDVASDGQAACTGSCNEPPFTEEAREPADHRKLDDLTA